MVPFLNLTISMENVQKLVQLLCLASSLTIFFWGAMNFNWRKTVAGCATAFLLVGIGAYLKIVEMDNVVNALLTYFTLIAVIYAIAATYTDIYIYITSREQRCIARAKSVRLMVYVLATVVISARLVLV